jgi:hypothetical protein
VQVRLFSRPIEVVRRRPFRLLRRDMIFLED